MNITDLDTFKQGHGYISVDPLEGFISLPSGLDCFKQTHCRLQRVNRNDGTKIKPFVRKHDEYALYGLCTQDYEPKVCPRCGAMLHRNGSVTTTLRHIPLGDSYSLVEADRPRFRCSSQCCEYSEVGCIPFKAQGHLITEPLRQYTEALLAYGLTLKEVAHITGLHKCVVKDIDKARLEGLYVTVDKDGKKTLIKPEQQARFIGIDEFKLHDGHKYATVILDMESGCILWLQAGKKKQVVYDFIDHVGLEWMSKVEAVSSDMNSDFEQAFLEKCPHMKVVYDHFHIVKNFNDKVVSAVRKEEQRRLIAEGDIAAAEALKGSKYILTSKRVTLEAKDQEAADGKIISRGSELFKKQEVKQKGEQYRRYMELISQNRLLMDLDWVKTNLEQAYLKQTSEEMKLYIEEIINYCEGTENKHFIWFARLLRNHIDGIISHAEYPFSNGKVEGINQKIKTIRRKSYGLPDDEYFFLKLFDASRQKWRAQIE